MAVEARRWQVGGRVQGVGFRPFVHRLAVSLGLTGWVRNRTGQVEIHTEGDPTAQAAFRSALTGNAPAIAAPRILSEESTSPQGFEAFVIRPSEAAGEREIHLPPDFFTCDDCLRELQDPQDRRYRYPFINCTQCGPRYTLIRALPYDRANTAMAGFPLCGDCRAEYADPLDRRFHAEPLACPRCGPHLTFERHGEIVQGDAAALAAAVDLLARGLILALKGIGGYHLLCDATDAEAVARLRERKGRPDKPLAVMFPAPADAPLAQVRRHLAPGPEAAAALRSPARPIVLIGKGPGYALAPGIAPGLGEVGAMLPYSPLHHLLLGRIGHPLVATSANLSGEPVLTESAAVRRRLGRVADAFLHHDRPILRPADDPVLRPIAGRLRPLRLGRGLAPLELELPMCLKRPVLATGGHMKDTLALAWGRRVVVSPHIGDLESARGLAVFEQVAANLQALYGTRARELVCDAHPGYATSRWAAASGLPVQRVWHHAAHASALAGEHGPDHPWLVFTWDGVGLGEDGGLWGGEALAGRPGAWRRVASLRPFRLPGGERAAREPWRSALGLCWELGRDWRPEGLADADLALLRHAWRRGLNAPRTSAVGRLFDAVAALAGVCTRASFEGQGPLYLEHRCGDLDAWVPLPLSRSPAGLWVSDWGSLIERLLDERPGPATASALLHATLAEALVSQALKIREAEGIARVGLAGGVFQNRILAGRVRARLREEGFETRLARRVPINDAGLSYGQVIEYAALGSSG